MKTFPTPSPYGTHWSADCLLRAKLKAACCGRPLRVFLFAFFGLVFVFVFGRLLLHPNHTKRPRQVVVRTGGEKELVGAAVVGRASPEFNSPELVDDNVLAVCIPDRANKLAGEQVKRVDGTVIGVVRDQQSVAQLSKIPRRYGEAPRLVQGFALRECSNERSVFLEDIDDAAWGSGVIGKGDIEQTADILNAERREACRQRAIGKRSDQVEAPVVYIDSIVGNVDGIQKISRRLAGDRQTRVNRTGCRVIDRDDGIIEIGLRRPSADGSVQSREQEDSGPSLHLKV